MIEDFLSSWPLFHTTYIVGWLIAVLLAAIGVVVVARDQIFLGAAVAQSSTLGIALALWCEAAMGLAAAPWLHGRGFHAIVAGAFSVLAALLTAWASRARRESHEAITGWVFLLASSFAVLLVAQSPHGLEEVQRIMASSIIGASARDAWTFGGATVVTGFAIALRQRPLILVVTDPESAGAVGLRVGWIEGALYLWLGLWVGLSIHVAGTTYAFGCLVLPALVAKNVCREIRSIFWVAPMVALGAAFVAFVVANHYDYPPAQATVALLATLVGVSWTARSVWGALRRHGPRLRPAGAR